MPTQLGKFCSVILPHSNILSLKLFSFPSHSWYKRLIMKQYFTQTSDRLLLSLTCRKSPGDRCNDLTSQTP